jgi:hypothetical protein
MKKGIYIKFQISLDSDQTEVTAFKQLLPEQLLKINPQLHLSINKMTEPDQKGYTELVVYLEGEQAPAADFFKLTSNSLRKTLKAIAGSASFKKPPRLIGSVEEVEDEDDGDDSCLVLPPKPAAPVTSHSASTSPATTDSSNPAT